MGSVNQKGTDSGPHKKARCKKKSRVYIDLPEAVVTERGCEGSEEKGETRSPNGVFHGDPDVGMEERDV